MNESNNEYYRCFQVILQILKIIGLFPFIFSHQGTSKHLFASRMITLLSIACFCVLCGEQYIYVIKNIKLIFLDFKFDIFIRIIPPMVGRVTYLILPLLTWRSSERIYRHMKKWQNIQDTLADIQKAPFSLPFKSLIHYTTVVILIVTILILIRLKPHIDLDVIASFSTSIPSFIFLGVTVISVLFYWLTNCIFVALVARNILVLINKSIIAQDEDRLTKLVELWANLYDWNAEFMSTGSFGFLIILSNMTVVVVSCCYTFTYLIFVEEDKIASLAYFTLAFVNFAVIVIFCESANLLLKQLATVIQETILTTNTKRMNFRMLEVIQIFLQTNEVKKPKIMLHGAMNLNRSSIISVCSTIINFLIVLKQFNPQGLQIFSIVHKYMKENLILSSRE